MYKGTNAVILDAKRRILLELRSDVPVWALPGGGVEENEAPEQAVVREVLEETGLKVDIAHYVGSYKSSYFFYNDLTRVYLCNVVGGRLAANYESARLEFFPKNRLPAALFYIHKERILDALSGKENLEKEQRLALWKMLAIIGFSLSAALRFALFLLKHVLFPPLHKIFK
mgnify:CR=1 FL=1